jgi:hypothetical protein
MSWDVEGDADIDRELLIGDTVLMPFMGASEIDLSVASIPEDQPFLETDNVILFVDQYGDEHLVENDGEAWVIVNPVLLSTEGYDEWSNRSEARETRAPGM